MLKGFVLLIGFTLIGRRIIIRMDVLDRFLTTNQDINLLELDKVVRVN